MKEFFDKFGSLSSATYIGVAGYQNKFGEIANINLLVNANVRTAKEKDRDTLKAITDSDLDDIAKARFLVAIPDLEKTAEYKSLRATLSVALAEMIASADKNLSEDKAEHTNQSKAQADAYIHLSDGVRMHKETMDVFVAGFLNSKTVLVEGEYPVKNKREKTKCKDAIADHCDLRMNKYRQYKVGAMDSIKITGSTLQML